MTKMKNSHPHFCDLNKVLKGAVSRLPVGHTFINDGVVYDVTAEEPYLAPELIICR